MKNKIYLIYSLILINELTLKYFRPNGITLEKILISLLSIIVLYFLIYSFFENLKYFSKNVDKDVKLLTYIIIGYSFICIIRSITKESIFTIFGKNDTGLGLLLPFAFFLGLYLINLKYYLQICYKVILIGIPLSFIKNEIFFYLLLPSIFLILFLDFFSKKQQYVILLAVILLFIISWTTYNRACILKITIPFFSLFISNINSNRLKKILRFFIIALFILPVYFINNYVKTGISIFQSNFISESIKDKEMSADTRTFLYDELFKDLSDKKDLLFGRGSTGHYKSEYFSLNDIDHGDYENRLGTEVGILNYLLKGGFLLVILYTLIYFITAFHSFFNSNSKYILRIGIFIVGNYLMLYIENIPEFNFYMISLFFLFGIAMNKGNRLLDNNSFKKIIQLHEKRQN